MRRAAALLVVAAAAGIDGGCAVRGPAPPSAAARPATEPWPEVRRLPADAAVRVETPRGVRIGRLLSASDQAVTLEVGPAIETVPRRDVSRIVQLQRQMAPGVLRAVLIATATGASLSYAAAESSRPPWSALLAGGWGSVAGVVGALSGGFGIIAERIVYEAAPTP